MRVIDKRKRSHSSGEANFSLTFNVSTNYRENPNIRTIEAHNRRSLQRLLQEDAKMFFSWLLIISILIKAGVLGMNSSDLI